MRLRVIVNPLSYSHHVRTYDFDSQSFNDVAAWAITTETAMDVLEPLPDEFNSYRAVALGHLRLMLVVDSWMANSTDRVLHGSAARSFSCYVAPSAGRCPR